MRRLLTCITLTALCIAALISPASAESRTPINLGPNTGPWAVLTYDDCPFAPWTGIGKRYAHGETPETSLARYKATLEEFSALGVAVVVAPTGMCVHRYRDRLGINIAAFARAR